MKNFINNIKLQLMSNYQYLLDNGVHETLKKAWKEERSASARLDFESQIDIGFFIFTSFSQNPTIRALGLSLLSFSIFKFTTSIVVGMNRRISIYRNFKE